MWCILCVATWLPVKSEIIKQRSNIFKKDSVVSTKLYPKSQERPSKNELPALGSLFGTVLLVNMYVWKLTGTLTALFFCHICTISALLIMKVFLLNLSKSNSRELLMIDIVLARYSASPTIYGTADPCELFRNCSLKCLCSLVSSCRSSKVEIPPRRNV